MNISHHRRSPSVSRQTANTAIEERRQTVWALMIDLQSSLRDNKRFQSAGVCIDSEFEASHLGQKRLGGELVSTDFAFSTRLLNQLSKPTGLSCWKIETASGSNVDGRRFVAHR